jgi:hypothetical protein
MKAAAHRNAKQFGAALALAVAGLAWRLIPFGLPVFALKYGGSLLWGAMVLFLVGAITPQRCSLWVAPALALVVAASTEWFRLFHTPELDRFRLTLLGALLMGRVFSVWNIVAYAAGIAVAEPARRRLAGLCIST